MNSGDWKTNLNKHDPHAVMLRVLKLAREAGLENTPVVRRALRTMKAFSYDWKIVQETAMHVERRLVSKLITQELTKKSTVPDSSLFTRGIEIGEIVKGNGMFKLTTKQLSEGLLIAGRPGAGKSNLLKRIMLDIKKHSEATIACLDVKNEYKDMLDHDLFRDLIVIDVEAINPKLFQSPHDDSFGWVLVVMDLLRESGFTLVPAHRRILLKHAKKLMEEKGHVDFFDLILRLEAIVENKFISLAERNSLEIPLEILRSIAQQLRLIPGGHIPLEVFLKHNAVIRMHRLSQNHASFFARLFLYWIYCRKDFMADRSPIFVVMDEAKRLCSREEGSGVPYMRIIAGQGRFLNMLFSWADQYPSTLEGFTSNVHTFVCFNQTGDELSHAAQYLGASEEQKQEIRNLGVGEALVKVPAHPYPFKIRVSKAPDFAVIDETKLKALMGPEIEKLRMNEETETKKEVSKGEVSADEAAVRTNGVLRDFEDFLNGLLENPDLGVSEFYERIDFSGRKGTSVKKQLLEEGMIEEEIVHTGERKRPQKKLKVTQKGIDYLGGRKDSQNG